MLAQAGLAIAVSSAVPSVAKADVMAAGMNTKMCIDLATATGRIALYDCHGGPNQNFFTTSYGQQRYDNGCLDTETDREGAQLIVSACNANSRTQRWGFKSDGTFRNETGFCADIANANAVRGNKIVLWRCNRGANNQIWGRGKLMTAAVAASTTGLPLAKIAGLAGTAGILSHNGSTLVGNDGASMVAAGGGNMVAAGGGNMVAAGGGNIIQLNGGGVVGK